LHSIQDLLRVMPLMEMVPRLSLATFPRLGAPALRPTVESVFMRKCDEL